MKDTWIKKGLVVSIIILFIGVNIVSNINANMPISDEVTSGTHASNFTADLGILSGHVSDSVMNPIEGARVRVYFHDTYRENYSDATGYYHVTDISICYCSKNVTCSKEGYKTEWIWLSIYENTTYDFVLTPLDGYCYPELDGTLGENGWYVSSVVVTFNGSLNDTYYRINGSNWIEYKVPFELIPQGRHLLEWTYDSNMSNISSLEIKIDKYPPILSNITRKWIGLFRCQYKINASDEFSGVNYVSFPFGFIDKEPPYQAIRKGGRLYWRLIIAFDTFRGYYYTWNARDNAGNCYVEPSYSKCSNCQYLLD